MVGCQSVRQMLAGDLSERFLVKQVGELCVATLPIMTIRGDSVDVFIETRNANSFLVHDAGRSLNELILKGVKVTPSIEANFVKLAAGFRVAWREEMFQALCKPESLPEMAFKIASCVALSDLYGMGLKLEPDSRGFFDELRPSLKRWSKGKAILKEGVRVEGA